MSRAQSGSLSSAVIVIGIWSIAGVCENGRAFGSELNYEPQNSCYAMAVYDELLKAIDLITSLSEGNSNSTVIHPSPTSPSPKKFLQEDYDEGGGGGGGGGGGNTDLLEIPSIVPMIFKVVGSALSLNSSGLTENSFGIIPENLSNRITSLLGTFASSILGPNIIPRPKTTRMPPPRRRRTRSTTTTTMNSLLEEGNGTTSLNSTLTPEISTEEASSTTEVLFKESSLGEHPVYASAYAPNYVATTNYPIYANNFLHVLYPAPTTTTVATTTTTTQTPNTTMDPNSFNIRLPFDYPQPRPVPVINMGLGGGGAYNESVTQQPPDYEEYEYEGGAEAAKTISKVGRSGISSSSVASIVGGGVGGRRKVEDEDDEYKDDPKIKASLGRISKSIG